MNESKPISAEDLATKFHNCLRSNCSEHETHEDCEKSLISQLVAYGEEQYQKGFREAELNQYRDRNDEAERREKEGYQRGIAEAADICDLCGYTDCGHEHCAISERIRGLGK